MQVPKRWDQVKEIVASALERNPDERPDYLRSACGEDAELRSEVDSLLSHHNRADSLLEESPVANLFSFPAKVMVGKQIGSYRILGETGQGGMAVVYLAERADQEYRKRVAIKMVKPGPHQKEIIHRFRNERQTLAALDHPHIVKLLDGGTTEEGWPYLVMDFVEGVPIDQYCDNYRLAIRERLELFRMVCQVVHYAHEHMVIHRDLKPSNILIASDGVPRLLDFGIAKLLSPECFQTPVVTTGDWRPMTPEYASPEQVRGNVVTQATDIYSLGVLLYELLTGHRPLNVGRHSRLEMERLVCEEEPHRPSTVVRTTEEDSCDGNTRTVITPELVSENRGLEPAELEHQLRGDLDTIVIKALRKEPERRFASAQEFAEDIARHLSGLPVRARKATLSYRSERFLGRHKESLVTAMAVLVVMAGLAAWQTLRTRKENHAAPQSGGALVQARPALAILGFKDLSNRPDTAWISTALSEMLTTELAAGEELRTVPGDTVARAKIDLSLPDEESMSPETLKRLRENLGSSFVVLGSYVDLEKTGSAQVRVDVRLQDTAKGETIATVSEIGPESQLLDIVSRAGTRLRGRLGLSAVSQLESQEIKASVASNSEAMRLYSQGLGKLRAFDPLAARAFLSRAVAIDPAYPLAHSALASTWLALGYDSNAREEANKAVDNADNLSRQDHLLVEARSYEATKQWDKAIETYRTLCSFFPDNLEYGLYLANAQTAGGKAKDALNTVAVLARLGPAVADDPRIDLARSEAASSLGDDKLYRDAAENTAIKAGKQGERLLVARARSSECRAFANLGDNEKAVPVCEEARQIYSELGDRSGLARTLHSMAEIPIDQGKFDSARKLYQEALSIARETGNLQAIGRELLGLGVVAKNQGDFVRALEFYRQSLQYNRKAGNKNGMIAATGNTANVLAAQGKLVEALATYKNVLALSEEVGSKSSIALALENMGEVLAAAGDLNGALKVDQQALDSERVGGQRYYYAGTLVTLGRVLEHQGDMDTALKNYVEAKSIQEQLGEKGPVAATGLALAELDCDQGKAAEGEVLARAAQQEFQAEKDLNHQIAAGALLSRALLQQGKASEAQQEIANAVTLSKKSRDVTTRMPLEIQVAYVRAAAKDFRGAEQAAQNVLAEASKLGFVRCQLEATLALGEIEMKAGNPAVGRARLERLEKNARAKGFELIAHKAAAAREGRDRV
jgi:serine/threonine protein kinase/tetratricopeptide (TPR) repeat protein/TolB-like protein